MCKTRPEGERETRNKSGMKNILYDTITMDTCHYVFLNHGCTTLGMDPDVNYGLQMIMISVTNVSPGGGV